MVNKTVLANGISVLTEEIPYVHSVSIGIWVRCGSGHESPENNGVAHFIEHMLFKGTRRRSTFDIAWAVDSIGGMMNAFTGKEFTSFYLKVPHYHLALAIDLLSDIFQNSLFDEREVEKEKAVICQEISMLEDTPEDYIHDYFDSVFWDSHPFGLPVLGTKKGVLSLTAEEIRRFFDKKYRGGNLIIAAAGKLQHEDFFCLCEKQFGNLPELEEEVQVPLPIYEPRFSVLKKNLEQVHLLLGGAAPSAVSSERYAAMILNALLGGAMSSRLFQEIREKRGLAYDVQSYLTPYFQTGTFGVYVGTEAKKVPEVIKLIIEIFQLLAHQGLEEKELRTAKEMLRGNLFLTMENTDHRMTRLARNEFYFRRHLSLEEVIAGIDSVTKEEVKELSRKFLDPVKMTAVAIGKTTLSRIDLRNYL